MFSKGLTCRGSTFLIARSWRLILLLLQSRLVAELRYLFSLSGSRSLPLYVDYRYMLYPASTLSALPASAPPFSVAMGYEYYFVQQQHAGSSLEKKLGMRTVTVYRLPIRLPAKSALTWPVV